MKENFKNDVEEDLLEMEILYKISDKKLNSIHIIECIILWQIFFMLFGFIALLKVNSLSYVLFAISYFLTFFSLPIYIYFQSKINGCVRTNESLEIAAQLKGLKKFIKDFSNIRNDGTENTNLFDEYVLYAIILNLPGKLNNEAKKLYNLIK